MPKFHFVEDYERHVEDLLAKHPLDEAMSLAVGGHYDSIGRVMTQALIIAGVKNGDSVFDLGCGSGRVAHALSKQVTLRNYLGTDVVEKLLSYARTKCPQYYKFEKHQELSVPAADETIDFAFAFSVFTHLLPEESFLYVKDIYRVLRPGGLFLFTYHDIANPEHREILRINVRALEDGVQMPLNSFLCREMIEFWMAETGFVKDERPLQDGWQLSWLLRKPG